jgi:class 3 adenylate cyclase
VAAPQNMTTFWPGPMTCCAGLHAGELERRDDDIAGMAVHIAARIEALAQPGEVLVSRTVKNLLVGGRARSNHEAPPVERSRRRVELLAVTTVPD